MNAVTRHDGGFGLLEVIVAIVLVSVGTLALSRTATDSLSLRSGVATRTTAVSIARSYMEDVRAREPDALADEDPIAVDADGLPDPDGAYTRSLHVTNGGRRLLRVTVRVEYPRSGTPVELVTLVYQGEI